MQLMADLIQLGFRIPLNYWLFANNLEVNVAKRVKDGESKLAYLILHCTGKAKKATKNCSIISEAEKGYEKAQEILYQRFEQKQVIVHTHISKLVGGLQLKTTDVAGLFYFSLQMQNFALTLD